MLNDLDGVYELGFVPVAGVTFDFAPYPVVVPAD